MNSGKSDGKFEDMLRAYLMAAVYSQVEKSLTEAKEISPVANESLSAEASRVIKEIEHFNLMNLINKALDERDKESFIRLTGELLNA